MTDSTPPQPPAPRRFRPALALFGLLVLALGGFFFWSRTPQPSGPASPVYREAVSAFYVGLIALQTGEDQTGKDHYAERSLTRVTELVPQEPAGWTNLGLLHLRRLNFDVAAQHLEKARTLAPQSSHIEMLSGLLESKRGKFPEAIVHFRRAVELDPKNLKAIYSLAQEVDRQGGADSGAEFQRLIEKILEVRPDNLAALLDLTGAVARRGDAGGLRNAVARIEKIAAGWPAEAVEAREQLRSLKAIAAGPNPRPAAIQVKYLSNVLRPVSTKFRQDEDALRSAPGDVGDPIEQFLKLTPPSPLPAPPDTALTFAAQPFPVSGADPSTRWSIVRTVALDGQGAPAVFAANGRIVRRVDAAGAPLSFPGGAGAVPPSPDGLLPLDLNFDYQMDLVLAGAGGVRLMQQMNGATFKDVTSAAGLPATVANESYNGAWAADTEADGDLDVVLGSRSGAPPVLRNNGDGTFKVIQPFVGVSGLRTFVWADFDDDGDVDAAFTDAGGALHVFSNERSGLFRARATPQTLGPISALAIADANRDGVLDVLALQTDGAIVALADKEEGTAWDVVPVTKWANPPGALTDGTARLLLADLDNNGGLDLIASHGPAAQLWLQDEGGKYVPLATPLTAGVFSAADLTKDGLLDFVGLASGQPVRLAARGTKKYHWQMLRPRANEAGIKSDPSVTGRRVNSFGIGGAIEIRSGLLHQIQPITGPVVHFGLGEAAVAELWRIVWPNGSAQVQAEFDQKADRAIVADQRLQTSCPFLFAWNGKEMRFVTDCIWRSPLGLKINAQDTAGSMQTEDWVKIRGDQLVPRDGFYDLRITAELWETHFFDHLSLMTVDHPVGTDVFVDERLAFPQPPLAVYATTPPHPVALARDDRGEDVTEILRAGDGRYLDTFGRGLYQGVTRDHWVEIELGDTAPRSGPLWLLAYGWIRPTNSSINVAIGQGRHDAPRGLSLEVPDGKGNWVVARPGLGFPEGKVKTILIDLDGVFRPGAPRRLRLRTNLEIYWDSISWATGLPNVPLQKNRLAAATADLRYRGFSVVTARDESSPEMPESYDKPGGTAPRWRNLAGYYTRFGDVRELLTTVDDHYVIMNAGDEMALRFKAPPPPPAGWVRDFVLIGDGWVKDGNLNTTFSKTVLPLPAHDRPDYTTPPGRLEDDPVYRRHPRDWREYHTRYVTPCRFQAALRPSQSSAR